MADAPIEREEYTAKQVATRIGTDSKTLRKFFRSSASTVEPVGQGGRYVFDADKLPQIKAEFDAWNKNRSVRTARGSSTPAGKRSAPRNAVVIEEDDDVLEIEEDDDLLDLEEDPTEEDLEGIEEEDYDLSELDDIEEL